MMKIKKLIIAALLFVPTLLMAQMPDMTLPVDKAVRMGKLDNGLTYYIRHNNWPENRANFYIAQRVGSIQEEESQRGLAHFLEHMAFNGSDNFKGNGIIEWCRSKGIEYGADLNAGTGIDRTVYNINNVPTGNQAVIDSVLLILRDWSCGLTLDPKEIDKERGVIHEEWRMRTDAYSRMLERNMPEFYPGSKYGHRYPIGLMSVIDNFKPKELVDYYHKWYHPQNQGIIVVGNVDVDKVEAEIKKLFGGIKNPANATPVVDELVPDNAKPIVVVDKDKEFQAPVVFLMQKHDVVPDSDKQTMPYLLTNYIKDAATAMLNNRFIEIAQKPGTPFVAAQAAYQNYLLSKTKDAFTLVTVPKEVNLAPQALQKAYEVAKQAADFGFTATEYKRYQDEMMSELDKQYSNRDKRTNEQFYDEIEGYFFGNEPMPDIDYYYTMMKQVVPVIPLEAINQMMPELLANTDSNLVIQSFNPEKEGSVYPTKEQLLDAVHQARQAKLEAYVDNVKSEPIMATMPKAGTITKEQKSKVFDYDILTLSNGVTVLLKKTDYKKDQVVMNGEGGQGQSMYDRADYANLQMFDDVIDASGLGNFSSTELGKALAGKIANAHLTMGERRMSLSANATPKDVETMLQLTYLYFTGIKKDQESFGNVMTQQETLLKNRDVNPDIAFTDSVTSAMYGNQWRTLPLKVADLANVDYDRILTMAKERTANANGWVFEIVGNFDEATIRPLICQYLGALPSKGANEPSKRLIDVTHKNVDNTFYRKMETPKTNAMLVWFNHNMPYSLENNIKLDVAAHILDIIYNEKVREEASAAYTVWAVGTIDIADDGKHLGQLYVSCPMKPEKKDEAIGIINDEAAKIAKTVDKEKLDKTKELLLKQIDDNAKTNAYWMEEVMSNYRMSLDNYTRYKSIVESLTPESIAQFMADYLKGANKMSVVMMPQE